MKRSSVVTLSLLGVPFAVGAALHRPADDGLRRNFYADRAACERDYSPEQCKAAEDSSATQSTGTSTSHSHGWYGPSYYSNRSSTLARSDPGPGRLGGLATAVRSTGSSTRGGFGGFARSASAAS